MGGMPKTMKVVEISKPGGPDVLRVAERAVPQPRAGEVLIRVEAAGVNRPDVSQREGSYPPPPGASDLPGLEVAGEIAAVGDGVTDWKPGDRVCALTPGGGYAEYCLTPSPQCLPIPRGLDAIRAAAIPETWFTVWANVVDLGRLAKGESLLVHGGTSGIGTTAIQLARLLGAVVYATAGSDEKCRFCEKLGAARGINYKTEDFAAVLKEAGGVDVVLDMVGGAYMPRNLDALKPDGRLAMIALLGGPRAEISVVPILMKRLQITGSTLRPRPIPYKARLAQALREKVWPHFESGAIEVVMDRVLPLDRAAEAHRRMESSHHIGKIVLQVA
jgi:putative PIG3 family NAD(P)H quinone oxidoreductase